MSVPLVFERAGDGKRGTRPPALDVPRRGVSELIPSEFRRKVAPRLPDLSEPDVVRHYTQLSTRSFGVDTGFYPLGSCTMKYNPKVNEEVARLPGFLALHPLQPDESVQGALQLMYELGEYLKEIAGLDAVSLQPAAGAHGELVGLALIRALQRSRGEGGRRTKVLVPDAAHGTNPASAALAGCSVTQVPSDERGLIAADQIRRLTDDSVCALMLTNPNTLGLFEEEILEISDIVHERGGLLYYDGANANALLGFSRPGDMGFDVVHFNLHKTFSTPHGCGGPGSGPIVVRSDLAAFLPVPVVTREGDRYLLDWDVPSSIGKVSSFYGNFSVMVKAYTYIRMLGAAGLRAVSEHAVLNANYLMSRLKENYDVPYGGPCMHEFVASARRQESEYGVKAADVAKRLLDFGFHAPTMYFPLVVDEALMIEPTETEGKGTLDAFADALATIASEVRESPDTVTLAPHTTPVRRLDEARAARKPVVRWTQDE